jgi:hypothetical protein
MVSVRLRDGRGTSAAAAQLRSTVVATFTKSIVLVETHWQKVSLDDGSTSRTWGRA